MAVIFLNNLVHEGSESSVTAVGTGIDSNTRISVLGTREDGSGEIVTHIVLLASQFLEDFLCAELCKE